MKQKSPHSFDVMIGHQLQVRRKMMGMSQSGLAKRVGVTFQQIQKYERGSNSLSARRLFELAQVLQISPMYFYERCELEKHIPAAAVPTTQTIHLVQDFISIPSIKIRNGIASLVREMAKGARDGV